MKKFAAAAAAFAFFSVFLAAPASTANAPASKCTLNLDTDTSSTEISIGRRTTPPPATNLLFTLQSCPRDAVFNVHVLPKSAAGPQLSEDSIKVVQERKADDALVVQLTPKLPKPGVDAGNYNAVLVISGDGVATTKQPFTVSRSDPGKGPPITAAVLGGLIALVIAGAQTLFGNSAAAEDKRLTTPGWVAISLSSLVAAGVATLIALNTYYFDDSVVFRDRTNDLTALALKSGAASLAAVTSVLTAALGLTFVTRKVKKRTAAA